MKFARCGGLSAVKQTHYKSIPETFHSPPTRRGTYAFIWPYYELFLVMWNERNKKEMETNGFRIFNYDGPIWCHLAETKSSIMKGGWYKTDTETLEKALKKAINSDRQQLHRDKFFQVWQSTRGKFNPYKWITKDHLEVFIEHVK